MGRRRQPATSSICVHGVGRNGRDFDVLGEALAPTHRVLAVDMPGRGESDWLADPNDYVFPTYLDDADGADRAQRRRRRRTGSARRWAGCSASSWPRAAGARRSRGSSSTTSGPVIEPAALARIGEYFGTDPTFATYDEIEDVRAHDLRAVRSADRRAVGARRRAPTCASAPTAAGASPTIPASPCPSARSRHRPTCGRCGTRSVARRSCCAARNPTCSRARDGARDERRAGPRPRVVEFAGVGHAPMLLAPDQVDPVVEFLRVGVPHVRTTRKRAYNRRGATIGRAHSTATSFHSMPLDAPTAAASIRTTGQSAGDAAVARSARGSTEALTREPGSRRARHRRRARRDQPRRDERRAKRLELAEQYWKSAALLWPQLEQQFARASHPLHGDALDAAKASLTLAQRACRSPTSTCSRSEATSAFRFGGPRRMVALVHRCLQCDVAHPRQQLSRLRAGAAANLARRARHLHVRARAQDPPAPGRRSTSPR